MPLDILFEDPNGKALDVDIVAIHGLNLTGAPYSNYAYDTWRKPSGPAGHLWLRDSLPTKVPNARAMLFSYDSTPSYNPRRLVKDATALVEALAEQRAKCPSRPLLLMGHDLGGILIKQMLCLIEQTMAIADPRHKYTIDAIFAIVFFGTPHKAPIHTPLPVVGFKNPKDGLKKMFGINTAPPDLMEALQTAGMFNMGIEDSWQGPKGRYRFLSVVESMDATVSRSSATLDLGSEHETILAMVADHQGICQFDAKDNVAKSNLEDLLYYLSHFCRAHLAPIAKARMQALEAQRNEFLKQQHSFAFGA